MKNSTTQQEVLLVTGTGFAFRQYCDKDSTTAPLSAHDSLKNACWNGMLKDILPEVFMLSDPEAKLYLWQMREAHQFLALEMGEQPSEIDKYFSIDPYCFMIEQGAN
jgi:hypothetical protein